MKKIFNNPMVHLTVAILITFIVAAYYLDPFELKRVMDAGRIGIYAVLVGVLAGVAWTSYWSGARLGKERIAVALGFLCSVILFQAIWVPVSREVELPDWLANGHLSSVVTLGFVMAGVGFLLPIGNTIGVTPPRNYWFLGLAGLIALVVFGLMIVLGIKASTV